MNRGASISPGPASVSGECHLPGTRQCDPPLLAEEAALPSLADWLTEYSVMDVDPPTTAMCDLLDTAIFHIYRAGLLIHTRFNGAGFAVVDDLEHVTGEMDAAIRQIQAAALESHDTLAERPPLRAYRAWSEQECRWVDMTFARYQAWLARPDLDPVEFAFDC